MLLDAQLDDTTARCAHHTYPQRLSLAAVLQTVGPHACLVSEHNNSAAFFAAVSAALFPTSRAWEDASDDFWGEPTARLRLDHQDLNLVLLARNLSCCRIHYQEAQPV